MPDYIGIRGRVTVEQSLVASLSGTIDVQNLDQNVISGELTTANSAIAAQTAQSKKLWTELYIDDGRGFAVLVPSDEVEKDILINESLDGWADQMTFTLIGEKWSPWFNSLIRGKRKVALFVSYGSPGYEFSSSYPVFSGYAMGGQFEYSPVPRAKISALDSAIKYSEEKVNVSLPVGSNTTRLALLYQILSQGSAVPVGTINLGEDDGGTITKSVSTPPDARKFEFLRDVLSPTGVRLSFSNGTFNARPFDRNAPIDRILSRSDISLPIGVTVPSTTAENQLQVVAVQFKSENQDGTTTTINVETTAKAYNPKHWIYRTLVGGGGGIDGPNGAIDPAPTERIVARVTTRRTYRGSVLVYQQIDEEGWYSPRAAKNRMVTGADPEHPLVQLRDDVNFYQYEDGTWHVDPEEKFQLIRRNITKKEFDAQSRFVVRQIEEEYFYHFIHQGLMRVTGVNPHVEQFDGVTKFVDESGNGIYLGRETIGLLPDYGGNTMISGLPASTLLLHPDSSTTTEWQMNADGVISRQTITNVEWGAGGDMSSEAVDAYLYGIQLRRYKQLNKQKFDGSVTTRTITYTQLTDETYNISDAFDDGAGNVTRKSSTGIGSRPRAEELLPKTSSQEIRYTVFDGTRISLNGVVEGEIHHEYCENEKELQNVANFEIRERSAWELTVPMPIEGTIHKDRWLAVDMPEIGLTPEKKLFVYGIDRNFASFRQMLHLRFYPPEVANL